MESLNKCHLCTYLFNLTSRAPVFILCCDETLCKNCWQKSFSVQNGQFGCPFQCGNENQEMPQQPRYNKKIMKAVEMQGPPIDIKCDAHV